MRRVAQIDPVFAATPAAARYDRKPWEFGKPTGRKSESPVMMTGLGFALALAALYAANDPDAVRGLLLQYGWPAQFLGYGMTGLSILIIGLVIFYLGNILRIFNPRATGRWNAGGLVAGAVAALGVTSMDPAYLQAGLNYAGFDSANDMLMVAQASAAQFAEIDWASVVMVSSSPK